jgi:hypothetical protein
MEDSTVESASEAKQHLVVIKRRLLDAILKGDKTIECRLMKGRCAPFRRVVPEDRLFFKVSSGPVCAVARVAKVKDMEDLTTVQIRELQRKYNAAILGPPDYWRTKWNSRYAVLIWLSDVQEIAARQIDKRDRSPWVVLSKERCYGLL